VRGGECGERVWGVCEFMGRLSMIDAVEIRGNLSDCDYGAMRGVPAATASQPPHRDHR
jgi:hypothetical protein